MTVHYTDVATFIEETYNVDIYSEDGSEMLYEVSISVASRDGMDGNINAVSLMYMHLRESQAFTGAKKETLEGVEVEYFESYAEYSHYKMMYDLLAKGNDFSYKGV